MPYKFNPFTNALDYFESGGGGSSAFFAGEVATYADLPLDGTAALNSRWLVRSNSGTWPFSSYKQAGVYVRKATVGASRDNDYQLTDTSFHDVMSDAAFVIYDDGAPTRSMQVEITDNETLTFKVTGTDSVVRSVAFALSAIVLAALMASSAMAQNIGLVTDTNGNVVTRRTNTLVWSNNLRFTPLTNANSRTAIIGTNGALTAGNPPSGAAANGTLLTADGAGSSSFATPRTRYFSRSSDLSRSNMNPAIGFHPNYTDDELSGITLDANTTYQIRFAISYTTTAAAGFGAALQFPSTNASTTYRSGLVVQQNTAIGAISPTTTQAVLAGTATNVGTERMLAGFVVIRTGTNAGTVELRWLAAASNSDAVTIKQGTALAIEQLTP